VPILQKILLVLNLIAPMLEQDLPPISEASSERFVAKKKSGTSE